MKTETIVVPRMLVKYHGIHPEPYGESFVILINDMYTDVYTNDEGDLFTITNNKELIHYLKNNRLDQPSFILGTSNLKIRTIKFSDVELLMHWMNSSGNWLLEDQEYTKEEVRLFISHAITSESHLFFIEKNGLSVGTMSYELHGYDLLFEIRIYEQAKVQEKDIEDGFGLLIDFVEKELDFNKIISDVIEEDRYHVTLLENLGFSRVPDMNFKTPVSQTTSKDTIFFELVQYTH